MAQTQVKIGSLGQTLVALRPCGTVLIEGIAHEARSEGGWIDAGRQVAVIAGGAFGLIVREATAQEAHALAQAEEERQQVEVRTEGARAASQKRGQVQQRLAHLVSGLLLGMVLGTALLAWMRVQEGTSFAGTDWRFPVVGLILGLLYGIGLQALHSATREDLSERWPETPGIMRRIVLPMVGSAGGVLLGQALEVDSGAILGAILGGLFLAPVLTLAAILFGEALLSW